MSFSLSPLPMLSSQTPKRTWLGCHSPYVAGPVARPWTSSFLTRSM